jgi:IclR family KDG regulon transcriptional repressor
MQVVDNIADILELFEYESQLGVREISRRAGISRSAAQRLVARLAQRGFLWQDPDTRQYRLGLRLLELGGLVLTHSEVLSVAEPLLRALVRANGETVHLAWLDDLQVLCLAKLESSQSIRMRSRVGRFSPLYCTSAGKAVLAFQSQEAVEQVIARGLRRYGPNTIVDPDELRRQLAKIRVQGFALDTEELEVGLNCVAAPLRDDSGTVFAAVSIAGPAQRMPARRMRELVGSLQETVERIGNALTRRPMLV